MCGCHPLQYARTEWIQNTLSPRFSKVIEMDYRFEEMQKLKFAVYDIDNVSDTLADDDFLGQIECNLGEVRGGTGTLVVVLSLHSIA